MDSTRRTARRRARKAIHRLRLEPLEPRTLLNADFRSVISLEAGSIRAAATALDAAGNLYVAGEFAGNVDFDPGPGIVALQDDGGGDAFVAKYGPAGDLAWARRFGGADAARATAVAVADGAVYVAGDFEGSADLHPGGPELLWTSAGSSDGFVVKLDDAGTYAWARSLGGSAADHVAGIALGGGGVLYVAGTFAGTADLDTAGSYQDDSDKVSSVGATDVFLAQYAAGMGVFEWARRAGGPSADAAAGVAADAAGNAFIAGTFDGQVGYHGTLFFAGSTDAFVMKVEGSGDEGWARRMGGLGPDQAAGVAVDPEGDVYVAGTFTGTIDFESGVVRADGGDLIASVGLQDAFVARLAGTTGGFRWARALGGSDVDQATGIAVDAAGAYVAGTFRGWAADLDPGPAIVSRPASRGERDGFAARLTKDGTLAWARGFGGPADDAARAIAATGSGRIAVAGDAIGAAIFGASTTPAPGLQAFIARLVETDDDYDGDGIADPATYRPGSGAWTAALSRPGAVFNGSTIPGWASGDLPVPLDYDGDGVTDKAAYRPTDSVWRIVASSGVHVAPIAFGQGTLYGGDPVPVVGDFDGDGRDDLAVYERSSSRFALMQSSEGNTPAQYGQGTLYGGDPVPVVGDFDGDGRDDLAVYERSSSTWWVVASSGAPFDPVGFGQGTLYGGDPVPVVGDFDGDGRDDLAVYERSSSTFNLMQSGSGQQAVQYGQGTLYGGDPVPVVGDFDGDGRDDLAVYQNATSAWSISQSTAGNRELTLGQAQDVPLPPTTSHSGGGPAGLSPSPPGGGDGMDIIVRFTTTEKVVAEGDEGWLIVERLYSDGSVPQLSTRVSFATYDANVEVDDAVPGEAADYTSYVFSTGGGGALTFSSGVGTKLFVIEAIDDGISEGDEEAGIRIVAAHTEGGATTTIGAPDEGLFLIPGSGGSDDTGDDGTGTPPPGGGGGSGSGDGVGGGVGGGSTPPPTPPPQPEPDPVPGNSPGIEFVVNDNADYLSVGESPIGIDDGPVWVGASSGDVVVSPNRISGIARGALPEWRSDAAGQVLATFDWTLPTAADFRARISLDPDSSTRVDGGWITFKPALRGLSAGRTARFSVVVDSDTLETGLHLFEMKIEALNGSGQPSGPTFIHRGATYVVDRDGGPFGDRWWVPELDRLHVSDPGAPAGFSWVRGDGTAAFFMDEGGAFKTPHGSFFAIADSSWNVAIEGPNGMRLDFDSLGLLRERRDGAGNVTQYGYVNADDPNGYTSDDLGWIRYTGLAEDGTVAPGGRLVKYTYDAATGLLDYVTAGRAEPTGFGDDYDVADGRIIDYAFSGGRVTRIDFHYNDWIEFAYDTSGRITQITRPDGRMSAIRYEGDSVSYDEYDGAAVASTWRILAMQPRAKYLLDPDEPGSIYIDPRGYRTQIWTDRYGYATRRSDPLGRTTVLDRDLDGMVTRLIDPDPDGDGPRLPSETEFEHDDLGRMTEQTRQGAGGAGTPFVKEWDFGQDSTRVWDLPLSATDEEGRVTNYTVTSGAGPDEVLDSLGRTTSYTYTSRGRVETVTAPDPDGSGPLPPPVTIYEYDDPLWPDLPTAMIGPDGSSRLIVYNQYGRPWRLTDELGRVTTYDYDQWDRLRTVTAPDPDGPGPALAPVVEYSYRAGGELSRVVGPDPDGGGPRPRPVVDYDYDALGRLVLVTGPDVDEDPQTGFDRPTTSYAYDAAGALIAATDPLGRTTRYAYDPAGQLSAVVDPIGGFTRYAYDGGGRLAAVVDPIGRTSLSEYDDYGRLTKAVDARGGNRAFQYDKVGNLLAATDPLGRTTTYLHDDADRPTRVTLPDPDGVAGPLPAPAYDYVYDDLDRLTRVFGVDPDGAAGPLPRPVAVTTYFDPSARKYTVAAPDPDGDGPLGALAVTYRFDAAGRLESAVDSLGRTTDYLYDDLDRLVRLTAPDPDGAGSLARPVQLLEYDGAGRLTRAAATDEGRIADGLDPLADTSSTYDGLGRLRTEDDFRGSQIYTYDLASRLIAVADRLGHATTYNYDDLDRLVRLTAPDGNGNGPATASTWRSAYDAAGQLRFTTDPVGAVAFAARDDLGRVVVARDPNGSVTRSSYDAAGNLKEVVDPLGNHTAFVYDDLDRVIREEVSWAVNVRTYAYDDAGNLDRYTDRNTRVTEFDHDNLGRVTAERWLDASEAVTRTIATAYDDAGRLISASDADSAHYFTYDDLDRLKTDDFTYVTGPSSAFSLALTASYDAAGRRTSLADDRGGKLVYVHDAAGRMTTAKIVLGGVTGPVANFTYDAADRLTKIVRRVGPYGSVPTIETVYGYDDADRLNSIVHRLRTPSGTAPLASYSYDVDPAGRVASQTGTAADGSNRSTVLSYDNAGQLISEAVAGGAQASYAYDAAGNRAAVTIGSGNRLLDDGTFTYQYDAEGNLVLRTDKATGAVREFAYDHRNRLTAVVDRDAPGGDATKATTYTYDPFDRRIAKAVDPDGVGGTPPTRTWTAYDGQNTLADLDDAGTLARRYLHGPAVDMILARYDVAAAVSDWYLADRLGSVRALARIDAANLDVDVLDRIDYDAFGNTTAETDPAAGDRFGFTARERDPETGLYYDRARYYDPASGRFLSQDPIGFAAGDPNLYRYVGNDPANFTDPSGLQARIATGGGTADNRVGDDPTRRDTPARRQLTPEAADAIEARLNAELEALPIREEPRPRRKILAYGMTPEHDLLGDPITGDGGPLVDLLGFLVGFFSDPHNALDAAGTFDPSPVTDTFHTGVYLYEGKFWDAGLTFLGVLPVFGDAFKALKHVDEVGDAGKAIAKGVAKQVDKVDELGDAARAIDPMPLGVPKGPPNPGGRLGKDSTRAHTKGVADEMERRGFEITGGGNKLPEEYLPGPGGGRKGSSFPDITATKNGRTVRVNTVDTRANGITPTTREARNAARIRQQTPGDHLILIPKPR